MTVTQRGPAALDTRALGPDLARGIMLVFIALANSHYFLTSPTVLGGYPQDGSRLDAVVTWAISISIFVHGRAFPMFGLLFGYGVAQIARRRTLWARAPLLRRLDGALAGSLVAPGGAGVLRGQRLAR